MEDPSKTNKPDDVVQSSVWESPNKRWLEAARLCSYQSICSPLSTIWYWHRWVLNLTKTRCFYIFNFCHSFQWVPITLSTIPEVHYLCVHPLVTSFIYLGLYVAHAHLIHLRPLDYTHEEKLTFILGQIRTTFLTLEVHVPFPWIPRFLI